MGIEDKGNTAAQRGTDIHQLGEMLLKGVEVVEGRSVIREYDQASMFYANRDMLDEAKAYVVYVNALATEADAEIIAEAKVEIIGEYGVSGHIDATVINGSTIHIVDLKTGRGAVSAEENLQMQLYALGTLDEHEMFYDFDKVVLHVVQDNASISNTNSWETTPEDLEDFRVWVTERARLALQEDSVCTPSESACMWCKASSVCPALFEEVNETFEIIKDEPTCIGIEEISLLLMRRPLFDTAMKAYSQRLLDEIKSGNDVEGYKVIRSTKRKAWVNETEAYDKLKSWDKLDDIAPRSLLTPTQAIKLFGKDISTRKKNILDELYSTPEGDLKLVPSSAKGTPVSFTDDFDEM
jgi:hypothetical protein